MSGSYSPSLRELYLLDGKVMSSKEFARSALCESAKVHSIGSYPVHSPLSFHIVFLMR